MHQTFIYIWKARNEKHFTFSLIIKTITESAGLLEDNDSLNHIDTGPPSIPWKK